jgi:hypothetical protein
LRADSGGSTLPSLCKGRQRTECVEKAVGNRLLQQKKTFGEENVSERFSMTPELQKTKTQHEVFLVLFSKNN